MLSGKFCMGYIVMYLLTLCYSFKVCTFVFQYPSPEIQKQREYHNFLANQIEEKNRNTRLGQLEEKRQAREVWR